ncbi:Tricarboxylate transport protein TctC [Thauera humireducens]|jgi:tripartite-type tricarboxylate transporter receptor subunit TctC|uniref:Tricarboxylate transport protein TctC n=3 Tax=Thauera humireducens TaxID=1134435 RepID=A0A127K985_9RHOO|nr:MULTISPECIES: tripartite tricarboxylate transporter substrate binding protein [Thauera]AMO38482.1 tricarboxylate transport protein TctC [Thauera humireducens]ENO77522.1 tricarboxylate transport protein TctC [Thauera sp. 63]CAH1746015.1 Tricarboxylate transport protein TctC [Thauera humireducens]
MMNYRKLAGVAALSLLSSLAAAQSFPEREVSGVIQWGPGGATDVAVRGMAAQAEQALGKKLVLQNKAGGVGVIGANFVLQQPSDGYTLLMGAENPALYKVMGLADFDYNAFYPVNIISRGNVLLVANKDKSWNSFKDLLTDVQANPGKIKMYTAGIGTVPFTSSAMIASLTKFPVNPVPFDGDGPGITAMLGGHVDFGFIAAGAVQEHIKAGRLKVLGVLDSKPYMDIPPMTEALPDLKKYVPWGSFFGVFAKKDIPDEAKQKLAAAFKTAVDTPEYRAMMESRGNVMLNISGDEAKQFIDRWQSVTAWVYQDAGVAKKNPAELGIPKP